MRPNSELYRPRFSSTQGLHLWRGVRYLEIHAVKEVPAIEGQNTSAFSKEVATSRPVSGVSASHWTEIKLSLRITGHHHGQICPFL